MTTQPELTFAPAKPTRHTTTTPADCAERMKAALNGGEWLRRRDLVAYGLDDRECRLGCEASGNSIIYGSRGYRLTRYATIEEINTCAATAISQGRKMLKKGIALKNQAHRMIGG